MKRYINRMLLAVAALFLCAGSVKAAEEETLALVTESVSNATVELYVSATAPGAGYTSSGSAAATIVPGQWLVAKVTPTSGYFTYRDLLTMQVVGGTGGAEGRTRTIMAPVHPTAHSENKADGTGYYYYQIPATCTKANGYTKVLFNGEAIEKIDLSGATLSGTTVTTATRADGWQAVIGLDAVSFTYSGLAQGPTISSFSLKKGTDEFSSTIADHVSISGNSQTNASATAYNATLSAVASGCLKNSSTAAFNIGKKGLTVTANDKTIKYGEDAANDGVTYSGFVNGETAAVLSGMLSYSYNTTADGTGDDYSTSSPVGTYYIIPAGLTSTNYDITFAAGELTVSENPIVIGGDDDATATAKIVVSPAEFTYNGNDQKPTVKVVMKAGNKEIANTEYNVKYQKDNTDVTETKDAGTYTVVITNKTGSYYTFSGATTASYVIKPAALTVTANDKTIKYGEDAANDGVTYSGFVNGETAAVLGGTLSYSYNTTADGTGDPYTTASPVGTYYIIPAGLTSTNYDITFAAGKLTVSENPIVIGGDDDATATAKIVVSPAEFTYNGKDQKPTVKVVMKADNKEIVNTEYDVKYQKDNTDVTEAKDAGTYTVVITNKTGSDYTFSGATNATYEIKPAALTVTAKDKTISYGDAAANDGVTYSGFVEGENENTAGIFSGTLSYSYKTKDDGTGDDYSTSSPVGTYYIIPSGLTSTNYTITYAAGKLTVGQNPIVIGGDDDATATAKIVVSPAEFTYNGKDQKPTVKVVMKADKKEIANTEYDVKYQKDNTDVTETKDAGTYTVVVSAKTGSNYTFTGTMTADYVIKPLTGVVVTITGHNNKTAYDGKEHKVTGYDVEKISNPLYTESDFTFNGTAEAVRTEVGKTEMGLAAGQFENTNTNFADVTFNVTDGYQEVTSIDEVIVTITGHTNTAGYDGKEHSVSGYDVKISNPLYTESDFTFTGKAEAKCTNAGQTDMGLTKDQFKNTNTNYGNVIFNVIDGYQAISPIAVAVTITGHYDVKTYDGTEHEVTGYDVEFSNALYTDKDFNFTGKAEAKRTDEGTTNMGLAKDQFENTSPNFDPVIFNVTDGYIHITSVTDVVVTITGQNNTADYDGTEHKVSGYDVKISNPLYTEKDFTFSGTAEAKCTDAGTTYMGLAPSQFKNTNGDFINVTFKVTDGYQTISPITATVTIKGHSDIVPYDGTEHKVTGYDVDFSNDLYQEAYFDFTGTAEAKRTDAGETKMGLADDQFKNTSNNFSTVTFNVTDGYQTINKKVAALTVTVTPKTYDGKTDAEVSVTVDTRVKGESLTITGLTGTFDNANAGTDKTVTVNSSKAVVKVGENTKLDNYEVIYPTQVNGTITKRPVVVSGITAQDKDYDGNTDATLVFDKAQFDGILAGDNLTVTATGKFENAEAGENKTVTISGLTLGGESVANYELAADGQQASTTATIRQTVFDRRHSGIEVRRNDTNELVDNDAFLTVMDDGTLRIDQVTIINPDPVNGIADGVSVYIPATLKNNDGTTGAIYGVGSDIIVTDANVPVTDIYMPGTDEMIDVAKQAFRLVADESITARIHTSLPLLDDYALTAGLKAEYEAGHVMTTITPTTQYWTLSTSVDIVVPEGATAYICQADGLDAVTAIPITSTKATIDGQERVIVKANNGVMMGCDSEKGGTFHLIAWPSDDRPSGSKPSNEDAKTYEGNMLVPATVETHFDPPSDYYILYENAFHELEPEDNTSVSPCKAVLRKNNPAMARSLSIHNEAVGIRDIELDQWSTDDNDQWYTLDGRRLNGKPTVKGFYILRPADGRKNGKKIFIK